MLRVIYTNDHHVILDFYQNKKNMEIIDLGFAKGEFVIELNKYFKHFKHFKYIGVEANAELLEKQKKIFFNFANIKILNSLISNTFEIRENFYINDNFGYSSFKKNINSKKTNIKTIDLCNLYKKFSLNNVDILKIDIEGAEIKVLEQKFCKFLSKNTKQIIIEFHDWLYPEMKKDTQIVIKNLKLNGFKMFKFSRNNGSISFVNKRFYKFNMFELLKIFMLKYYYGLKRITKRLVRNAKKNN